MTAHTLNQLVAIASPGLALVAVWIAGKWVKYCYGAPKANLRDLDRVKYEGIAADRQKLAEARRLIAEVEQRIGA